LVTYGLDRASYNQGRNAKYDFSIDEEQIGCQTAKGPGAVGNSSVVRRLTPLECTRLQGFPDEWMNIGEWVDSKGKLHKDSDAAKYKAAGNSIALPFWQWLMHRISEHLKKDDSTMASLFDGIGGFPLCSMRAGITPVWASEIEEFPMAVTKYRFGTE
jgi:DNA (cytosine-5)-methyltransferase 1